VLQADLALYFAAAQDRSNYAQPQDFGLLDLEFFRNPWNFTLQSSEEMLEAGALDSETVSWGVIGLCSGYMDRSMKESTRNLNLYKARLHNALKLMPSLDRLGYQWHEYLGYISSGRTTVNVLGTARSEIHSCNIILLQRFVREGWATVRLYHCIAVAERWAGAIGVILCSNKNAKNKFVKD